MNFRKCGHLQESEECQACRHDAVVEQLCKAKADADQAVLMAFGAGFEMGSLGPFPSVTEAWDAFKKGWKLKDTAQTLKDREEGRES